MQSGYTHFPVHFILQYVRKKWLQALDPGHLAVILHLSSPGPFLPHSTLLHPSATADIFPIRQDPSTAICDNVQRYLLLQQYSTGIHHRQNYILHISEWVPTVPFRKWPLLRFWEYNK